MKILKFLTFAFVFALLQINISAQQTTPPPRIVIPPPTLYPGQEMQKGKEQRERQEKENKTQKIFGDDVIRVDTALVQVDATVTDKNGNIITDLKPEDFELLEDGKPQKISFFSFVKVNPKTSASSKKDVIPTPNFPSGKISTEQVGRTIAIVLDDNCMTSNGVFNTRAALKKFVNENIQPNDLVGIFRSTGSNGALQQFTTDKAVLNRIVNTFSSLPSIGCKSEFDDAKSDYTIKQVGAPGSFEDAASKTARQKIEDSRNELATVSTLNTLGYVLRGLKELPGRKTVVLLSDGLTLYSRTGLGNSSFALDAIKRLVNLANAASVVFNTIDSRGLVNEAYISAADDVQVELDGGNGSEKLFKARRDYLYRSQDGMRYLAAETGGRFLGNSNNLAKGLAKVLDDQSGYYLLGYEPNSFTLKQDNSFRKLSVRVKYPEATVRHRFGFYGAINSNKQNKARSSDSTLYSALISPVASNGMGVKLTSFFGNDPKTGNFLRFVLYLDPQDLTFSGDGSDGKKKMTLDIAAVTLGADGKVVDEFNRTHTVYVDAAQGLVVSRNGLTYTADVPVKKSGLYQLRVAVRDANSQKVGAASQSVEIPDLKDKSLIVTGLTLSEAKPNAPPVLPSSKAKEEALAPVISASDSAVRIFHPGMIMSYNFLVYNPPDKTNMVTQVKIYNDGKLFFEGPETTLDTTQPSANSFIDGGMIRINTEMPVGNYVLQVTARNKNNDKQIASQWTDFEIIK